MLCKCKLSILSRNMAHNTKKTDSGKVPDTQVMASGLAVVFFRAASQHRNDAPKLNAALKNWRTTNYRVSLPFNLLPYQTFL